jgi:hypothetical protein
VRSAPRPSFPRTPLELQRCFATPAALCRRRGRRGVSGRVSRDIAGRTDSAARVADTPRPGRCRRRGLRGCPSCGNQVSTTAGTAIHRTRTVIGWRARPETFAARPETLAACGFSDLRAGFVLRDESGRRQRSRAPHGSGRAAPEHDAGSPAVRTRLPRLAILRSTNWARISEEPAAGRGVRGRGDGDAGTGCGDGTAPARHASSSRRLPRRVRLPLQSSPQPVGRLWRRFLTWARCGSRRPTTRSRGPATSRGSHARPWQKQTGRRQRRNKLRPLAPTPGTQPEATG